MKIRDFREFVFRATGKDTDLDNLDLIDNLVAEVDRLGALEELLQSSRPEEFDPRALSGVSLLLGDIRARMRAILDLGLPKSGKKAHP
jgi:hypothetical protein